jgi:stage II sporulation protein AA (anti-sigma F factor antagonist)
MNVTTDRRGETLVVIAEGRVDGANAAAYQAAIQDAIDESDKAVVLDFSNLTYISSAGLRVILLVARDLQKQGAQFAACSLSAPVKEVFSISGFDKIIPVHDSQDEAIGSFKK